MKSCCAGVQSGVTECAISSPVYPVSHSTTAGFGGQTGKKHPAPNSIPSEHRHLQGQLGDALTHLIWEWSPGDASVWTAAGLCLPSALLHMFTPRDHCTKRRNSPQTPSTGSGCRHEDHTEITTHKPGSSQVTSQRLISPTTCRKSRSYRWTGLFISQQSQGSIFRDVLKLKIRHQSQLEENHSWVRAHSGAGPGLTLHPAGWGSQADLRRSSLSRAATCSLSSCPQFNQ